ncbi:hypothetical protein LLEC1_05056 [Akanthomyces lecanii]|uniref:Uncharacterized protein n=1 Tax=Cordyceps confragosa TaxID=2714763 RepID=A0A179I3Q5_CORDF|nr:hypothetical protein LLEC1_05056 [Akanthomyces lecanii]
MFAFFYFVPFCLPAARAGGWDDFSNNPATDLAPFLSLFGEQITKQYLSESITPLDYFIFALAPLGILTAVVSVIRVCGGPSLRAFIGRAQEGGGIAEAELCSSTSQDVCELYHNGGIARVFGRPKILAVVYDPEFVDSEKAKAGIYPLQDYLEGPGAKKWHRKFESEPGQKDNKSNARFFAPNLSLNIGIKKQPTTVFWIVCLGGLILQGGVLLLAAIVTYHLKWKKDEKLPNSYACPLVLIGTLLLGLGIFLCAFLVGQSTDEAVWYRKQTVEKARYRNQTDKSCFFWVQPGGQIVGDQTFGAFCYSDYKAGDQENRLTSYTTSWKSRQPKNSEYGVWAAIAITISGFVLQFTG